MKLTLAATLTILLALFWTPCYAQGPWGVTAGGGISKIVASNCRVDQVCSLDGTGGFSGGVYLLVPQASQVAFQPELLFTRKGGAAAGGNVAQKLNYLEIPALARASATIGNFKPFLLLGPTLGVLVSAKNDSGTDVKDDYHPFELGFVLGGGAAFTNRIGVEFRFQHSVYEILTTAGRTSLAVANQRDNKIYNQSFSVMVDVGLGK